MFCSTGIYIVRCILVPEGGWRVGLLACLVASCRIEYCVGDDSGLTAFGRHFPLLSYCCVSGFYGISIHGLLYGGGGMFGLNWGDEGGNRMLGGRYELRTEEVGWMWRIKRLDEFCGGNDGPEGC